MEVENQQDTWEGYLDWRYKPAVKGRHGGMRAASFVLFLELMENITFSTIASNVVLYMTKYMHFKPANAANSVTNFLGTAYLLTLLGGFLSDAFFTTYVIYLMGAVFEFLGLIILTVQAHSPSLYPPPCSAETSSTPCQQVSGGKAAMLFIGLYLVALGAGGIKASLPTHGAEQFDESTPQGRKQRSTFFNYFVFCLSSGGLIAVTFVVWIEDNKGWEWGFVISIIVTLVSICIFLAGSSFYKNKIPCGSPITTICKVLLAAILNSCLGRSSNAIACKATSPCPPTRISKEEEESEEEPSTKAIEPIATPSESHKFLDRAIVERPVLNALHCTTQQVEDVKIVIKIFPIFACTIMLYCCLAQLSTFSVEQAATMDTRVGSLTVPPASLPIFPVVFIMILAPVYDHLIIPFARKITKSEMGISHLRRIGIGLFLSILAMATAALVEIKRKRVATKNGLLDSPNPLPISFFWIAFQFLFLGSADLFTLAGLLEFFFTEAPSSMRSVATSLSWASMAVGYLLSTVIVSIVNSATRNSKHQPWLSGTNLNYYHLQRFYWLLCALTGLNFLNYLFWANRYKYHNKKIEL